MPTTPNGIYYKIQYDGYKELFTAGGNTVVAWAKVAWSDAADWKAEMVGWTEWDGTSTYLNRHLPVIDPQTAGGSDLYCDSVDLVKKGGLPAGAGNLDDGSGWLNLDYAVYQCMFRRPSFEVLSDDYVRTNGGSETLRYVSVSRRYVPKERRRPGYVFEYDAGGGTWRKVDEVGFIPDYEVELLVKWWQIPEKAYPESVVETSLVTVNSSSLTLRGRTYAAGTLLFKGTAQPIEPYGGADGSLYVDPIYVFAYRKNTWNKFRKNDGTYTGVRVSGLGPPDVPPYASTDHQLVFTPSAST